MESLPPELKLQVSDLLQWAGDRMEHLNQEDRVDDLISVYEEWFEWIENPYDTPVMILGKAPPGTP